MDNPFIIQRDIQYGEPFCDREEEIERCLSAARMGESICLISPRRYGKTSLLNQVAGKLVEQGWLTAKIDFMQSLSEIELAKEVERTRLNLLGTWRRAIEKFGNSLQVLKKTKVEIEFEDLQFSMGMGGLDETNGRILLKASLSRLREFPEKTGMPLMVYLDEFQRVREIDPKGNLEAMIRAAFQKRTKKSLPMYLGSRRHMLQMMFADKSTPLFKSATLLSLDTIRIDRFASFASQLFKQTIKSQYTANLVSVMGRFFQGHPHLLNKTAALIWDMCQRDNIQKVSQDICRHAMLDIIREETDAFLEVNRKTPLNHMTVFRQIAVRGTVSKPYSAEFLRACSLTQSQMQKIIDALISDDRIYRDDTGVHIVDPLEGLALRMMGSSPEWRSEMISSLLSEA
jgi:AAA+ ATPase superfamily predicted ATPase